MIASVYEERGGGAKLRVGRPLFDSYSAWAGGRGRIAALSMLQIKVSRRMAIRCTPSLRISFIGIGTLLDWVSTRPKYGHQCEIYVP